MKNKRISIILIAIAFALIVVFSCIGLFSVKKVQVSFAVSEDRNVEQIQSSLDSFLGDNLLFLKTEDVESVIKSIPNSQYLEIAKIEKSYPNVLKIEINERREVYYVKSGQNYYVTTADGFVLNEMLELPVDTSRDKILLELDGVNIDSATVGDYLQTSDNSLMQTVFLMAKSVKLTDCIKKIHVFKPQFSESNVTFETYTGVNIIIEKVEVLGIDKVVEGFNAYDNALSDYIKTFDSIIVNLVDGKINVDWSNR